MGAYIYVCVCVSDHMNAAETLSRFKWYRLGASESRRFMKIHTYQREQKKSLQKQ